MTGPGTWSLGESDYQRITGHLTELLKECNARSALVVDRAGQLLATAGEELSFDPTVFASLTAADFSANDQLAKMIGEPEFASLFHQGEKESMYLADVARRVILVVLFDQRTTVGLVRLRVKQTVRDLAALFEEMFSRAPGQREKGGSDDEYEKLLKACEDRELLYLYVLTLGETGARCESEALWTQWEDVDLEEGFLQVVTGRNGHRTKSGKSRWVPMSPRLTAAVKQHFARYRFAQYGEKKTPWVFHHTKTRRHHKAGERIRSLYSAFKAAADRAKLPSEFVQHDLRHRRVTTWLAEEKSVVLVREAVGHADLRTTMAYTHLAREHLRGLVDEPHREEARNRA